MSAIRVALVSCVMALVAVLLLFPIGAEAAGKTVYAGGTMSLTGPFAEDSAAILHAYEDYVRYVNETKRLAPWRNEKWPADVAIELLWRDDELKPAKALSICSTSTSMGTLVQASGPAIRPAGPASSPS